MKKQTQFSKGQNERKTIYNREIREIYRIGHLVKTNPIQSQTKPILFSPQIFWGLKTQFEKTKPIFERLELHIFCNDKSLWRFWSAGSAIKQSQFKAKQSQLPNFGDFVLPPCLDKVCRKQEISVGRQRHKIGQDTLKPQSWPINE